MKHSKRYEQAYSMFDRQKRFDLDEAIKLLNQKRLTPVIDKIFPLKKAAEAQAYMESRKNFGKIVLSI